MASYTPEGLKGPDRKPKPPSGAPAGLGVVGWLRWMWRQLTSMRVALMLLMLLAVVSLPGAFLPQRARDAAAVAQYLQDHPDTAPLLDKLYLFDAYTSPWFSAVYLLLFISLIGCIVPRTWAHLQAMRQGPGAVPRNFTRFDVNTRFRVTATPEQVLALVGPALGRRYRHRIDQGDERSELSAERGFGRESGNLAFHLALVGLLIVTAWGQLVYYRGQVVIVEGDAMVNSAVDYDSFESGAWFDETAQEPFRILLQQFQSEFTVTGRPDAFIASVDLTRGDGSQSSAQIEPNHPLAVGSANVYLTGNGYAPDITVTDATGEIAFEGPVLFLPQDTAYTSTGVIQVPDANGGVEQLGFSGQLFPTAVRTQDGTILGSSFPQPDDPVMILNMWTGDLGLDDGVPQNLFALDTDGLQQVTTTAADGSQVPVEIELQPGQTVDLPDGQGTITFGELHRFAALDVRWDPSVPWMGVFAALAVAGLAASLFLPRRRLWVRVVPGGSGSVVSMAALARGDDPGLQRELDRIVASLSAVRPKKSAKRADRNTSTPKDSSDG